MPASTPVIALVHEPRWKRSSIIAGMSTPNRRVPATPAAAMRPFFTTAAAIEGSAYFASKGFNIESSESCARAPTLPQNGMHSNNSKERGLRFIDGPGDKNRIMLEA
jgi:hypothetical protein